MSKTYLLTAEPRTGKTTCIKKIIEALGAENCEGFYTEEIRKDGERIGFDCVTLTGERIRLADMYSTSDIRVSRYGVELDEFERLIVPLIEQALLTDKILILDEVGPMELFSTAFQNVLEKALNSDKLIIGTIFYQSHPDVDRYKEHPNVQLISLTEENREEMPFMLLHQIGLK